MSLQMCGQSKKMSLCQCVDLRMCYCHACSVFGELKSLRIPKKLSGTGTHRGFGFADFLTKEDAKVSWLSTRSPHVSINCAFCLMFFQNILLAKC